MPETAFYRRGHADAPTKAPFLRCKVCPVHDRDDGVAVVLVDAEGGPPGRDGSVVIVPGIKGQLLPRSFHLGDMLRSDVGKLAMHPGHRVGGPL